ncbi:hypothetical protein G4G30_07495 [Stenotrophomonas maltophilia]|nr:hypothetical protein G4G30_07495 [Stenotrophomonas maltophilia]
MNNDNDKMLTKPPFGTVVNGEFISIQDAEDFMAAMFKNRSCPWCEATEWDLILRATEIGEEQEDGYVVFTTEHYVSESESESASVRLPAEPYTFPMFLVICDNCGFARTHSLHTLQRWKHRQSELPGSSL